MLRSRPHFKYHVEELILLLMSTFNSRIHVLMRHLSRTLPLRFIFLEILQQSIELFSSFDEINCHASYVVLVRRKNWWLTRLSSSDARCQSFQWNHSRRFQQCVWNRPSLRNHLPITINSKESVCTTSLVEANTGNDIEFTEFLGTRVWSRFRLQIRWIFLLEISWATQRARGTNVNVGHMKGHWCFFLKLFEDEQRKEIFVCVC